MVIPYFPWLFWRIVQLQLNSLIQSSQEKNTFFILVNLRRFVEIPNKLLRLLLILSLSLNLARLHLGSLTFDRQMTRAIRESDSSEFPTKAVWMKWKTIAHQLSILWGRFRSKDDPKGSSNHSTFTEPNQPWYWSPGSNKRLYLSIEGVIQKRSSISYRTHQYTGFE